MAVRQGGVACYIVDAALEQDMAVAGFMQTMTRRAEQISTNLQKRLLQPVVNWLSREIQDPGMPLIDFERLREHLRPGDVVLVEGLSRMSGVIQAVTLSSWTHAALYLGRLDELEDRMLARRLAAEHNWADDQQLLIEAEVKYGCIIIPLQRYHGYHLRICRPRELSPEDRQTVLDAAIARLGAGYDLRQIFDLLRFLFPYGLLPRRWRSSLFEVGHGDATRLVCSTLIAESFRAGSYPILPHIQRGPDGGYVFRHRNSRLFTPRDFDHSPYFDIIKYPFFGEQDAHLYRDMDWEDQLSETRSGRHKRKAG